MARPLPQPARIYQVGGAVRDELLGRPNADRDFVVVGATPETMLASGFRPVGRDFPVFLHPETNDEYALARTERKHGRGYRGFEFFASPDVTLEEDLARRDLTINAMARGDDGVLVDPYGGRGRSCAPACCAMCRRRSSRIRCACCASRASPRASDSRWRRKPRRCCARSWRSGELATLATERVWQELASGLSEAQPSRMLAVLRACGALRALLPEVDALFGVPQPPAHHPEIDTGVHVALALDWSAAARRRAAGTVRRAGVEPGQARRGAAWPRHHRHEQRNVRARRGNLRAAAGPVPCRDAARLAARWQERCIARRNCGRRRCSTCCMRRTRCAARNGSRRCSMSARRDACSRPGAAQDYPPATAAARSARRREGGGCRCDRPHRGSGKGSSAGKGDERIAKAVRAARLKALRAWRRRSD